MHGTYVANLLGPASVGQEPRHDRWLTMSATTTGCWHARSHKGRAPSRWWIRRVITNQHGPSSLGTTTHHPKCSCSRRDTGAEAIQENRGERNGRIGGGEDGCDRSDQALPVRGTLQWSYCMLPVVHSHPANTTTLPSYNSRRRQSRGGSASWRLSKAQLMK